MKKILLITCLISTTVLLYAFNSNNKYASKKATTTHQKKAIPNQPPAKSISTIKSAAKDDLRIYQLGRGSDDPYSDGSATSIYELIGEYKDDFVMKYRFVDFKVSKYTGYTKTPKITREVICSAVNVVQQDMEYEEERINEICHDVYANVLQKYSDDTYNFAGGYQLVEWDATPWGGNWFAGGLIIFNRKTGDYKIFGDGGDEVEDYFFYTSGSLSYNSKVYYSPSSKLLVVLDFEYIENTDQEYSVDAYYYVLKNGELELLEYVKAETDDDFYEEDSDNFYEGVLVGDYPEASQRPLNAQDLSSKSKWELSIMRNEIFARHGYKFSQNKGITTYFESQDWYNSISKVSGNATYVFQNLLSDIEKANIELIGLYEKR